MHDGDVGNANSNEFSDVQRRAMEQVNNPVQLSELVLEYRERFGTIIDADHARELFPAYARGDKEARSRLAPAVHEAASRVAKGAWDARINEPAINPASNYVVFLAGGSGSGKGTFKENYLQSLENNNTAVPHALYDTTFSNYADAKDCIEQALASDKFVAIYYVHRPVELAAKGVKEREQLTGRSVPMEVIARNHYHSQKTLESLSADYANNPSVKIHVVDNSRGHADQRIGAFSEIVKPEMYASLDDVNQRLAKETLQHDRRSEKKSIADGTAKSFPRDGEQSAGDWSQEHAEKYNREPRKLEETRPGAELETEIKRVADKRGNIEPTKQDVFGAPRSGAEKIVEKARHVEIKKRGILSGGEAPDLISRSVNRTAPSGSVDGVPRPINLSSADEQPRPQIIGEFTQREDAKISDQQNSTYTIKAGKYPIVGTLPTAGQRLTEVGVVFSAADPETGDPKTLVRFEGLRQLQKHVHEGRANLSPAADAVLKKAIENKLATQKDDGRTRGLRR